MYLCRNFKADINFSSSARFVTFSATCKKGKEAATVEQPPSSCGKESTIYLLLSLLLRTFGNNTYPGLKLSNRYSCNPFHTIHTYA